MNFKKSEVEDAEYFCNKILDQLDFENNSATNPKLLPMEYRYDLPYEELKKLFFENLESRKKSIVSDIFDYVIC